MRDIRSLARLMGTQMAPWLIALRLDEVLRTPPMKKLLGFFDAPCPKNQRRTHRSGKC